MSTTACGNATHPAPSTRSTVRASVNGAPGLTAPLAGSLRTSERSSCSSTKYGPSVCAGVSTQAGRAPVVWAGARPASATVTPPRASNAERRAAEKRYDSSPLVMVAGISIAIVQRAMIVAVVAIRNRVAMKALLAPQIPVVALADEIVVVGGDRATANQRARDRERQHCPHVESWSTRRNRGTVRLSSPAASAASSRFPVVV